MLLFHPQSQVIKKDDHYVVLLYTEKQHSIERVLIRAEPDHEETMLTMKPATSYGHWQAWKGKVPISPHSSQTLYCFKIISPKQQVYLHAAGQSPRLPQKYYHFKLHQQQPPSWVREHVFYQIFPERFANGDDSLTIDPEHFPFAKGNRKVIRKQWGEPVSKPGSNCCGSEFYGGDLVGITQRLDYLQDLGVSALYLNPIFTSPSNHKYDTVDYFQVDPSFGGNEALITLSNALKQREMKLILDAVVNHTSNQHPYLDYFKHHQDGAHDNPSSPYRDYYHFNEDGYYWGWKGVQSLPKLNFANPEVQQWVYKGEDAIIKHWLREPYSIDGWRFDVIHMLGEHQHAGNNAHYLRSFRQAIKQTNPKAYMIGEHFSEASQWLQGDQEDGAMNYYGFAHPVAAFILGKDVPRADPIHLSAQQLAQWLREAAGSIPFANQLAQYNLLDSHDTARFQFLADEDISKVKLASTLLLTYLGVPSIYYGDEIGLTGGYDPGCRECFPWDESQWDMDLLQHYKQLIALRHRRTELQQGDLISLVEEGDIWVFARWLPEQHSLIVINRGESKPLNLDLKPLGKAAEAYQDLFSKQPLQIEEERLHLTIAAHCSMVITSL